MEMTPSTSSSLCGLAKNLLISVRGKWMRTVCGWHSAGSQAHPHIRAFGSRTIRHARVYKKTAFTCAPAVSTAAYLLQHYDWLKEVL